MIRYGTDGRSACPVCGETKIHPETQTSTGDGQTHSFSWFACLHEWDKAVIEIQPMSKWEWAMVRASGWRFYVQGAAAFLAIVGVILAYWLIGAVLFPPPEYPR
jgi:hypothetical protein